MAEVNANSLTTKTTPASTDSMLLFGTTSNEGSKITYDNLADAILDKISTKTFANQVGGSSAATILAQLSTLNSNLNTVTSGTVTWNDEVVSADVAHATYYKLGRLVIFPTEFTPIEGKIDNSSIIAYGLPQPMRDNTFVYGYNGQQFAVNGTGNVRWYFPNDKTTIKRIDAVIVYFSAL